MSWFILALLSAFFDTFRKLYSKSLVKRYSPLTLTIVSSVTVAVLSGIATLFSGIPSIQNNFFEALFITAIINAIASLLLFKAIRLTDISVVAPLLGLSPFFLLITSPFMLGEFPTQTGLAGVLFILLGTYFINVHSHSFVKPFTNLITHKGQRLVLLVTLIWAVSSNMYKIGITTSSLMFFIFSLNVCISLMLLPFFILEIQKGLVKIKFRTILPLGFLAFGTSISQWSAATLGLVVYAISIKRLSSLMTVILGGIFFQEKGIKKRFIGSVFIIIGLILITVF